MFIKMIYVYNICVQYTMLFSLLYYFNIIVPIYCIQGFHELVRAIGLGFLAKMVKIQLLNNFCSLQKVNMHIHAEDFNFCFNFWKRKYKTKTNSLRCKSNLKTLCDIYFVLCNVLLFVHLCSKSLNACVRFYSEINWIISFSKFNLMEVSLGFRNCSTYSYIM